MPNQLDIIANARRAALLGANRIIQANPYSVSHPDALADGDSYGRGEYLTVVGTKEDLISRKVQQAANIYNASNEYKV